MAKSSAPSRAAVRSFDDAVARIRTQLPIDIDIHLAARSGLRRTKYGLHATESYELRCYEKKLKTGDEYYAIVATTPRELYDRYVSEFLPAVKRAFAPPPPSDTKQLTGQRVLRLGHKEAATI